MQKTAVGPLPGEQNDPPKPGPVRLHELDGLRGWAALSVVLFHIFWETFGAVVPGFSSPATAFILDGHFAVWIFFVLSGEALSTAYFAGKGDGAVIKLAVRRYPRLTLPILATCALVLALQRCGLTFNHQAAVIVHREDWLGSFLTAPFSLVAWLRYALLGVYLPDLRLDLGVPFLWTMHYEMLGSFLVFGVLLAYRHLRWALPIVLVAASALMTTQATAPFACFLFGVAFSRLRMTGFFAAAHGRPLYQIASWGVVAAVVIAGGHWHMTGGLWERLPLAPPLVFAISCNKVLCDLFASAPSRLLGTLSFPIYLMQFAVLTSFTSWAIIFAQAHGGLAIGTIWAICLTSLTLCFAAAALFLPVEAGTRRVGEWLSGVFVIPAAQDRR